MARKVEKTDAEWKEILSPAQFAVCRGKGTEPAFSGKYAHSKDPGIYQCSCCGVDLFDSDTKYESGTGWPSFWQPLEADNVETEARPQLGHGPHRSDVQLLRRPSGPRL